MAVSRSYRCAYPEPLKLKAGERVACGERKSEWPGWRWCTSASGKEGWVPASLLSAEKGSERLLRDYDAAELTVRAGEGVAVISEESGWGWCRNGNGAEGWLPMDHLEPYPEPRIRVFLRREPLEEDALRRFCADSAAGAVVSFAGAVRDHHEGERVISLEYDAYEAMALGQLRTLAECASERWPLRAIAVEHRLGPIPIGEAAVCIVVSADHRREAFEACAFMIGQIKEAVPIWKKETTASGSAWLAESEWGRGGVS